MRLCAYWDCMEEVEEGISFCREHSRKLNLQLIDKCPKCGRYKDVRQKLCPDCNYGRPVAGWKISSRNLDEVDESPDSPVAPDSSVPQYDLPAYEPEVDISSNSVSRGEANCPSCGSPNLTYKKVFDYFKCNDCETTFITPVYSYGDAFQNERDTRPVQPEARNPQPQVRQEPPPPPVRNYPPPEQYTPPPPPPPPSRYVSPPQQQPRYNPPPQQPRYEPYYPPSNQPPVYRDAPPAQRDQYWPPQEQVSWDEPAQQYTPPPPEPAKKAPMFNFLSKNFNEDFLKNKPGKMSGGQASKTGWMYLGIIIAIVIVIAIGLWFVFPDQLSGIMGDLF